jgi:tetratricopeptide (TPR) repeat protein
MAALLLARGATEDADALLKDARPLWGRRPPSSAWYHYSGLAAMLRGDLHRAAAILEEGIQRHPRAGALYANLSVVQERRGAAAEAAATIERGLQEDPGLPQLHKGAGDSAYRAGRYDAALESYQRAARLCPELGPDLYLRMGNIRYRRGEVDLAREAWSRALQLDPQNGIARGNLETLRRMTEQV